MSLCENTRFRKSLKILLWCDLSSFLDIGQQVYHLLNIIPSSTMSFFWGKWFSSFSAISLFYFHAITEKVIPNLTFTTKKKRKQNTTKQCFHIKGKQEKEPKCMPLCNQQEMPRRKLEAKHQNKQRFQKLTLVKYQGLKKKEIKRNK